jgi:chemotaxis protein MotB
MARKKEHEKEPNHERWLVSYADFITLLFAVFVTLYAMSQTDKAKVEQVVASMQQYFGFQSSPSSKPAVVEMGAINIVPSLSKGPPPTRHPGRTRATDQDFRSIKASIQAYLMKSGAGDQIGVQVTQRGLVVSLKESGFFDSGSAVLKPSSLQLLNDILTSLSSYSNGIRIEGHTDNLPTSSASYPSNWELSTARATNVLRYMVKQDFDPAQLSATGYGEYRPAGDNSTPEGRSKNRRVDLVLLSETSEAFEP